MKMKWNILEGNGIVIDIIDDACTLVFGSGCADCVHYRN